MTIRNWFKFAFRALIIGGVVTGLMSLIVRWGDFYAQHFSNGEWGEAFLGLLWFVLLGFTMSMVCQMGYFAYLTVHQIGVNICRSLTLWNWVQILLMFVALLDVILFRFKPYAYSASDWLLYIGLLIVLIAAAILTAMKKVKMTGKKHILISALFFMIFVSIIEWLIALWVRTSGGNEYITLLLFPILAVNAFQLLELPKYNAKSAEDLKKREERRAARRELEEKNNKNAKHK
ncbi:KinB-signaling pathway activation protein [Rummeliibacillus sp. SL167]|uniref:KinB-signaling pathway activation protein n=1 Tax=Rummeliibacillus sp. SL167 TaxID=2579792 RepID=UPI0011B42EF6|nr:KinB-signaling pathway activation protein [Rummeliibacillus sp. SL167]